MNEQTNEPSEFIKDEQSLSTFIRCVKKFNELFCKLMYNRAEFSIRLEVRGIEGRIVHCRMYTDEVDKPLSHQKIQK